MTNQLYALIGVTLGAVLSYLVGMLNERTRWRREQGARWDGMLLQAYSDYGQAIKECVVAYQRLAAYRGLTEDPTPMEPTNDGLEQAAKAEARRAAMTEPLRLLADPATANAVRKLNDAVWHLEWMARGRLTGEAATWEQTYGVYRAARQAFYEKARAGLQVPGGVIAEREIWPPSWRAGA
ncbi:hypothetical protein PV721_37510 [Streptomyces sp. MB09-01]|uniref:hypothetical protein n=1 Tax=Streptomyces sp. MB09-01 TaxID=3028666 RepID=UPI0029A7B96D|nr:hypothetical protein [Streptomyces sp. MB09-01]MDX3539917.1 hypothetical protein [Streptomyces sp. MB09-01]